MEENSNAGKSALSSFLARVDEHTPKPRTDVEFEDDGRLEIIYMNARTNQGIINFIPIAATQGDPIRFLYDVAEWQVCTDAEKDRWVWGKVLQPKDYVSKLTPAQIDQVAKIHSNIKHAINELDYDLSWARIRNYAIIFGYVLSHKNNDKETLVDSTNRKMALLVFPSKNFSGAIKSALNTFDEADAEMMFNNVFNRESVRDMFLETSFALGTGFGYDVSISIKEFGALSSYMLTQSEKATKTVTIPQEEIDKCFTPSARFLGVNDSPEDFLQDNVDEMEKSVDGELAKYTSQQRDKAQTGEVPPPPTGGDGTANQPTNAGWPTKA